SRDRCRRQTFVRAIVVFLLRLAKPAQHCQAAAALLDSAIMISPGYRAFRASACVAPCRGRRSQRAVCRRKDRDSAGATIDAEDRTRCIQDASGTWDNKA